MRGHALAAAVGALALTASILAATPTQADETVGSYSDAQADPIVASEVTTEEIVYDNPGKVISDPKSPVSLEVSPSWSDSGGGGTSESSGCKTAYVHVRETTALGFTAYRFHIWTSWCWNRANGNISNVDRGWYLSDVDSQYYWQGIQAEDHGFFAWRSGYPRSGYKHMEQGQFDNCVLKYGCIGTYYPTARLRVHSDGTWWWEGED